MGIWKKTLSAALAGALLASVAATTAFAALPSYTTTAYLSCLAAANPSTCSQVADGISTVTLEGAATVPSGDSLYITATGASIISVGGQFTLTGSAVTAPAGAALGSGDTITLRSPSAPGSAAVNVYTIDTATGVASLDGTLTITFTASSGLDVSAANSTVKTYGTSSGCTGTAVTSAPALPSNTYVGDLCVTVEDGNGNPVNGAVVTATISPVGGVEGDFFGQTTTLTTGSNGVADISIWSTGIAGTAVISTSATFNSKTTSFAPVSFMFTGTPASLVFTQSGYSVAENTVGTTVVGTVNEKDASGNLIGCDAASANGTWAVTSGTTTVFADGTVAATANSDGSCNVSVPAPVANALGSSAFTLSYTPTSGTAIKAAPFTVYASGDVATVTVAFSAATITPGGTAKITVTAVDAGGRPVADTNTAPTMILSAGAATPLSGLSNGMATATYLAPFNTGTVTALATVSTDVSASTSVSGSGSANVGAVVPVTAATNASALGVTKTGPFTTTTKVAALGKYVTFKMSFGAAAAGQHVSILVASKSASGVWSTFAVKTARVADASGNVYFYWRSSSAAWLSIRGSLSGTMSNAVQARWR